MIGIFQIVILLVTSYSVVFYSTALSVPILTSIGLTLCIIALSWLYFIGDNYGKKTGKFWMKLIGAVCLGTLCLSLVTTSIGYLLMAGGLDIAQAGIFTLVLTTLSAFFAYINNYRRQNVKRILLNQFQLFSNDTSIVQITDIHLNGLKSKKWVKRLVSQVNALNPDIIVFTGDLIDIDPKFLGEQISELKKLKAKLGKLAISGNHDFYQSYSSFKSVINDIGFTLLDNDYIELGGLSFIGLPDKDGARFGINRLNIQTLYEKCPNQTPLVVLDHRPDHFKVNANSRPILQLSGHTHAGQLPPFGIFVRMMYCFTAGQHKFNKSTIYVSRGTSTWGPPMRLFKRGEITQLV
jgi:uncharacterized protein